MKTALSISLLLIACCAQSQTMTKFNLAVGGGYAHPVGDSPMRGLIVHLEPSFLLFENVRIGLNTEVAVVEQERTGLAYFGQDFSGLFSMTAFGEYYFTNFPSKKIRPFAGAGVGIYLTSPSGGAASEPGMTIREDLSSDRTFGFYPRLGFRWGRLKCNIDYNTGPTFKHTLEYQDAQGPLRFVTRKSVAYLGLKCGFVFGARQ